MSASTKSLLDVWMEYYEPQWTGHAEVSDIVKVSGYMMGSVYMCVVRSA